MSNILQAIWNISQLDSYAVVERYKNTIRIQQAGDALEYFIKDAFSNAFTENALDKKEAMYREHFSYLGNANNPPDFMLRNGDAIEVKKIQGWNSTIALNSSYPKNRLFSHDNFITKACRECEEWTEKDIIYVIGTVKNGQLLSLWMVYGELYVANKEIYDQFFRKTSNKINPRTQIAIPSIIDPLGITRMRQTQCSVINPNKSFDYLKTECDKNSIFTINALISNQKYMSFPTKDRMLIESAANDNLTIKNVWTKSPNNSNKLIEAKFIRAI